MISFSNLMKRLGVGGRVVAFFKCVGVYFLVLGAEGGEPSAAAALAKCLPVLWLAGAVAAESGSGARARRVAAGLALSAAGDAALVWPQLLPAGMALFAAAHVAYVSAFGWRPLGLMRGAICYVCAAVYCACVAPQEPSWLRALVPLYAALLATMTWRALERDVAAAAGGTLFALSDALLGYTLFSAEVPHAHLLVMTTYYLGQLGIALSVLRDHS